MKINTQKIKIMLAVFGCYKIQNGVYLQEAEDLAAKVPEKAEKYLKHKFWIFTNDGHEFGLDSLDYSSEE